MSPWTSAAEVCPFDAFSSRLCCDSQIQKQQPKSCGQPPIDDHQCFKMGSTTVWILQSLQFAHLVEVKEWEVFIRSMKHFDPNTNLRMNSTEDVSRSLREKLRDVFQHHWPHIPTLHFTRSEAITILGRELQRIPWCSWNTRVLQIRFFGYESCHWKIWQKIEANFS